MNMNRACQAGWARDDNIVSNVSQHEDDGGDDEEGGGELCQGQGGDLSAEYAPPRLWLAESDHVTWILASDWLTPPWALLTSLVLMRPC